MTEPWKQECVIAEDWRKIELRPNVWFKVTLNEGKAEMCFGLFSCYAHEGVVPRVLKIGEPRFSAAAEYERFLYLRGKGHVTVEEIEPE